VRHVHALNCTPILLSYIGAYTQFCIYSRTAGQLPEEPKMHQNSWRPGTPLRKLTVLTQSPLLVGRGGDRRVPSPRTRGSPCLSHSGFEFRFFFAPHLAPAMLITFRRHWRKRGLIRMCTQLQPVLYPHWLRYRQDGTTRRYGTILMVR